MTKTGIGTGTVTSSPGGISCGSTCTATFANGTSVRLTATPAGRSRFAGWSGDCSGTGACVLSMTTNHSVTARFNKPFTPAQCRVPRVVGLTVAKAKTRLRAAHCSAGKVTKIAAAKSKKGKVLAQSPRPGKRLRAGAKVNLTVGR